MLLTSYMRHPPQQRISRPQLAMALRSRSPGLDSSAPSGLGSRLSLTQAKRAFYMGPSWSGLYKEEGGQRFLVIRSF